MLRLSSAPTSILTVTTALILADNHLQPGTLGSRRTHGTPRGPPLSPGKLRSSSTSTARSAAAILPTRPSAAKMSVGTQTTSEPATSHAASHVELLSAIKAGNDSVMVKIDHLATDVSLINLGPGLLRLKAAFHNWKMILGLTPGISVCCSYK